MNPTWQILRTNSIPSTNVYALSMISKNKAEDGMVVITNDQTAGKGQEKNYWESKPGENLTFSIIVKPKGLQPSKQFMLNKITSLAVYDFVNSEISTGLTSIKWPNDVYVGNKKIAGILISNIILGNEISWAVVGTGININQVKFERDAPNPVSLKLINSLTYNLENCLERVLHFFDLRLKQLLEFDFKSIDSDYLNKLYRKGISTDFIYENRKLNATITGIGEFGHLILQSEDGETIMCDQREIKMIL